jgi:Tfp pilus assembly protein PilX
VQLKGDRLIACVQLEAALASAERQIERLRMRERAQAKALMEARHQLQDETSASSMISEDGALTPEAGVAFFS